MGNIFKLSGSEKELQEIKKLLATTEETNNCILEELRKITKHLELITDEEIIDDNN
jgi:hypothetical protein